MQRATGTGAVAGLAALLVATVIQAWPEGLLSPYAALLALTAFCGVSILWITASDMRSRGTSGRRLADPKRLPRGQRAAGPGDGEEMTEIVPVEHGRLRSALLQNRRAITVLVSNRN